MKTVIKKNIKRLNQYALILILTILFYFGLFYFCSFLFEKHFFDNIIKLVITNKTISVLFIFIVTLVFTEVLIVLDKNNKSISFVRNNFVIFILLFIYILFFRYWENLIGDYIIGKFLRYFKSSILNDAIFIVASFIVVWFGTYRLGKKNTNGILIWLLVILFWVYYRWICKSCGSDDAPYYLHYKPLFFEHKEGLKYIDFIPFIAICQIVTSALSSIYYARIRARAKYRREEYRQKSFWIKNYLDILDNPIKYDGQDILMRNGFAKSALDELNKIDLSDGSFTFGIDSPWGAGKTSFMNLMKNLMIEYDYYSYRDSIIIDFNPWLYVAEKNLVTAFFDELSKHLEPYDHSLAKNIIDYSKLLSAFDTKETKLIASLIDLTKEKNNNTLTTKKRQITNSLEQVQIPIFVFIDDLDRLNADELMEMLKLIRNTSNFPYMCFIAAYDRAYLIECLEKLMKTKGINFVEKIFQHEFHLPPCPTETLRNTLSDLIVNSEVFNTKKEIELADKSKLERYIKNDEDSPLNGLSNLREVKRLAMHFLTSYRNVIGDINVVDLLLIEFIKTKYPLVFSFFERKKDAIQEIKTDNKNYYGLYKGENDVNHIDLIAYIQHNRKEFKLSHLDRLTVEAVFHKLFPDKIKNEDSKKRINEKEWNNRYFNLKELETDIQAKEFEKALKKEFDDLTKAIDKWLELHKSISLRHRILTHEVENHEDKQMIIRVAFYFNSKANIKIEDHEMDRLIKNLKGSSKSYDDIDKEFISKLLIEYSNDTSIRKYIGHINNDKEAIGSLFNQKEIVKIQQEVFNKFKNNNEVKDVDECFRELLTGGTRYWNYDKKDYDKKNKELLELMKTYAEEHMVDYIPNIIDLEEYTIYLNGTSEGKGQYSIDRIVTLIWGNLENFYSYFRLDDSKEDKKSIQYVFKALLKVFKKNKRNKKDDKGNKEDKNPIISEFKAFLMEYKKNKYKKTKFSFKHIKREMK